MVEAVVPLGRCDHVDCQAADCSCPCHGPAFPLDENDHAIKRVGLGYHGVFPDGLELTYERVRESRGEIHGELFVQLVNAAGRFTGHLFRGNFNASSATARSSMAKHLSDRISRDWKVLLEQFCLAILQGERRGAEFQLIGRLPSRRGWRYLLEPILPLSKPTIIFGPGGTGKSTLAGGIAVAVATGKSVLPGWSPTPGGVLFLDWEEDDQTWNDRLQAIAGGVGAPSPEVHYRRMSRSLADDVEPIANHIAKEGVLLVVVDAMGMALGSGREGESWSDGTFRFFEALRQLDVTALLIDHVAGSDLHKTGPTDKPFGSVYKVNLARSVFELRAERDGSGERTELLLLQNKPNGPRVPSQGFAIVRDDHTIRFERSEVDAPELVSALPLMMRIQQALRGGALATKTLAETLGIPEGTIRQAYSRDQRGVQALVRLGDGRIALASH